MNIIGNPPTGNISVGSCGMNNNLGLKNSKKKYYFNKPIKELKPKYTAKRTAGRILDKALKVVQYATLGLLLNIPAPPIAPTAESSMKIVNNHEYVIKQNTDKTLQNNSKTIKFNPKANVKKAIKPTIKIQPKDITSANPNLLTVLNVFGLNSKKDTIKSLYEKITGKKETLNVHLKTFLSALPKTHEDSTFVDETYQYIVGHNEKVVSKNVEWPSNIKVLASNGQNTIGLIGENSYSNTLADLVSKKGVNSIEQANDILAKGYKITANAEDDNLVSILTKIGSGKLVKSLETPGKELNIFNKKDKHKQRFIISFYTPGDQRFYNNNDEFIKKLQKTYKISDSNVSNIPLGDFNLMKVTTRVVANQIKKLKNIKNAELLVLFRGHGAAVSLEKGAEKKEGAMQGIIAADDYGQGFVAEFQAKKLFTEELKGIKTLFILDCCHSGAWIAQNKTVQKAQNLIANNIPKIIKKLDLKA